MERQLAVSVQSTAVSCTTEKRSGMMILTDKGGIHERSRRVEYERGYRAQSCRYMEVCMID